MTHRCRAVLAAMIVVCPSAAPADEAPATKPAENGFVKLYNGQDVTGWQVQGGTIDAWKADGELLSCVAEGGGWLRTEKTYSDFVLKVEYRIPPGGNSGVGLRFPGEGNPAHDGMEIQILDDDAPDYKDLIPAQYTGGIYYQAEAKRGAAKPPGEWNAYEITCRGPQVKVVLNGQTINDVSVEEYSEGAGEHKALCDRPGVGYVGLQSHGSRVDFRNIELKDLTTTSKSGLSWTDVVAGEGEVVPAEAAIAVHYTGRLTDGRKFDSSHDRPGGKPASFTLTDLIKGWQEGIPGMRVGGRRRLVIPPALGYGEKGAGDIPPDATLVFDVEVVAIRK